MFDADADGYVDACDRRSGGMGPLGGVVTECGFGIAMSSAQFCTGYTGTGGVNHGCWVGNESA
jgi:hypothetical protein